MCRLFPACALLPLVVVSLPAQTDRIRDPVETRRTVKLSGNLHPLAQLRFDQGRVSPEMPMGLVTVLLTKTAGQQADLEKLLEEQQDRSSPAYHRWLTPEQYGARFGASVNDSEKVASWFRSQGLAVERVARGRNWVSFSGNAGQIEKALHTEIHRYLMHGETHYAAAFEPSIPAALAPVVGGFTGMDDFDGKPLRPAPRDTLSDGSHAIAPDDFATIYDATGLYAAGITGAGQKIAIAGRSDVNLSDIRAFRAAFGLSKNDPQFLVYGPDPGITNGQGEATGDIENAMAVARDASLILVTTTDVFTSVAYAVDDNLAPVISLSSGTCEKVVSGNQPLQVRSVAQQANAEGITWVAGSGDNGAAGCDINGVQSAVRGLSVTFPGGIPEVTAVGGTQFAEDSAVYWRASNSPTGSSALSYIPEEAWNEASSKGIVFATAGGASVLYAKPAWQTGPGVPQDGARDVPDVSFEGSCATNFYMDYFNGSLSPGSCGTSAAAPSFAGVLALLNQYLASKGAPQPGLGNVNPELYRLAQNSTGVFHDITTGDNIVPCKIGTPDCATGSFGYLAGPGYDLTTGLGSIDIYNFVTQWSTAGVASAITLSASTASVALNGSLEVTATVTAVSGSVTPTGTVTISAGSQLLGTAPLVKSGSTASASLTIYGSQLTPGTDTLTALYSGDANLNGSAGSVVLNVTAPGANSAVIPAIAPNPVYQLPPDANGNTFHFTIALNETAGVGTVLAGFTIDGVNQPVTQFFSSAAIAPKGTISAAIDTTAASVPATHVYGFSGVDASGFQWHQEVTAYLFGPVLSVIAGIQNAASGEAIGLAPGGIISVYGANFSQVTLQAATVPLPLSLGGVTATVKGVPAPLFFVAPGQVNLQIPYEAGPGPAVVEIDNNGQEAASVTGGLGSTITVLPAGPGIFVDGNGNTVPFASGSRGQTLTLFITGYGAVSPPVATGAAPAPGTPVSQFPAPTQPLSMTIGGEPSTVTFAGIPSALVGVMQINFQVPVDAPLGPQPVVVTVGGKPSRGVATLTILQ